MIKAKGNREISLGTKFQVLVSHMDTLEKIIDDE